MAKVIFKSEADMRLLEDLSWSERGKILTLMFLESMHVQEMTRRELDQYKDLMEDRELRIAYKPFGMILQSELRKYDGIVQRNRENGSMGGRPKGTFRRRRVTLTESIREEG